jgi:hypothetical protein
MKYKNLKLSIAFLTGRRSVFRTRVRSSLGALFENLFFWLKINFLKKMNFFNSFDMVILKKIILIYFNIKKL